jgi:hypothetical protein
MTAITLASDDNDHFEAIITQSPQYGAVCNRNICLNSDGKVFVTLRILVTKN